MSTQRKIPYVRLGNSGLKVSKIILGAMQYGDPGWQPWVLGEEEAIKHVKVAYEAGIQTFDTANVYSNGLSEIILGKAIKELKLPRDEIVVMTKLYATVAREFGSNLISKGLDPDASGYVNQHGLSRKMQALHDVVKAGYVRYIGMSSCYAWQFSAMQNYALNNKLTPFISMQNHYSLLYREEEREMFPTLKHFGVGAIPWSPLARGLLARPLSAQTKRGDTDPYISSYSCSETPGTAEIIGRVEEVAKKREISMAQVAIAWILSKEGVSAPIVGTTNLKNLEDIIAGANVKLTDEEIKFLEEPYKPQKIIGHF
ncbi:hypothetical protein NLJ89_g2163 [Agrocybe chaxingu]|uniref:NADP-dependent oxidoreductase domain-containing protein n=1 Tax=Agrocybe chaxingu TaxID=84603 RepID=A0A9W8MXU9_9AGAR|nr:hypothetical protein NLJ89_g2163 [Agrocybe chaxingu]